MSQENLWVASNSIGDVFMWPKSFYDRNYHNFNFTLIWLKKSIFWGLVLASIYWKANSYIFWTFGIKSGRKEAFSLLRNHPSLMGLKPWGNFTSCTSCDSLERFRHRQGQNLMRDVTLKMITWTCKYRGAIYTAHKKEAFH